MLASLPEFLILVLATWLGMSVLAQPGRGRVGTVFALLTLLAAVWSGARLVWRASALPQVRDGAAGLEALAAALLPATLLYMALAFTTTRRTLFQNALLVSAYVFGLVVGLVSAVDREHPIAIGADARALPGIPGPVLGWAWIGFRALVLAMSLWWVASAWRGAPRGSAQKQVLGVMTAAVALGALGAITTILAAQLGGLVWPGPVLIAMSLGLAAYAVFGRRALLSADIGRRSFVYSLLSGLVIAAYTGVVMALERVIPELLGVHPALVTAAALLLTLALFDPVRRRVRRLTERGREGQDREYRRLLRALSEELAVSEQPRASVGSALEHVCSMLGMGTARVVDRTGAVIASVGEQSEAMEWQVSLPLQAASTQLGLAEFGARQSGPYTPVERDLLADTAAFITASLRMEERQAAGAEALEALARERSELHAREESLVRALAAPEERPPLEPLRVYVLGPMRVERGGKVIRQWGGAKAGTRQAQALFAFLFDRGERGLEKDEALELIWPDVQLQNADLAFHRTLGGLRRMLEPEAGRAGGFAAITFHNDRYRLNPEFVAWSDVEEFDRLIAQAQRTDDPVELLSRARALYRGEYMDDCPFYGDSLYVEQRRSLLRGRYVDLLLALGEEQERRGADGEAAGCYREALAVTDGECDKAEDGLERLGVPAHG